MFYKFNAACAQIPVFNVVLKTNVSQQASKQRLVQGIVSGRLLVELPTVLSNHCVQLLVNVSPLACSAHMNVILSQQLLILTVRQLVSGRLSLRTNFGRLLRATLVNTKVGIGAAQTVRWFVRCTALNPGGQQRICVGTPTRPSQPSP